MVTTKQLAKMIGNTPLIKIRYKVDNKVMTAYFKCEWYNLTGSIKDRVGLEIIIKAHKCGVLKKGGTIAEVSSGNMGISLCAIGAALGYKVVVFMPKNMSEERKAIMRLYGGDLRLVENFKQGFEECEKLGRNEGVFLSKQFENIANIVAYKKCAREIYSKVPKLQAVVAGVGTSGTLMGLGAFFKQKCHAKIIAVEPSAAPILSGKTALKKHKIQGLSDEIVPKLYDKNIVDDIIGVSDDDAIAMAQKLSRKFGLSVGISGGANFVACASSGVSECLSVFADDNKKYLSTDIVHPICTPFVDKIQLISYEVL